MKPTLLILAAGLGSRYGGLKQLDQIGPSGETLMDYSIYDAIKAGFGKVVFVIRKSFENDFKTYIFPKYANHILVEYVFQELDMLPKGYSLPAERLKPWGTGHAVLMANQKINEPFAVINADDFYGRDSFMAVASFLNALDEDNQKTYCLLAFKLKNTLSEFGSVSRGLCYLDKNDYLKNIEEHTKITIQESKIISLKGEQKFELSAEAPVSMNLMGFTVSAFKYFKYYFDEFIENNINDLKSEFYLPEVMSRIIKSRSGKVRVLPSNEKWFGVTYKEDRGIVVNNINEMVKTGIYPKKLWN
jgi:bifunctional N-acetylglucosamine-1-phosphate-uridyltransferase/glucosamine-1-phosphate-acetyltransferase GlmU-like protein